MDNEQMGMRINKFLSDAGVCSRREADRLIALGEVKIDGALAEVGSRVFPGQKVTVKNEEVKRTEKADRVLLAFHKPKGVECTSDPSNPDNIINFLHYDKRIYTVGRLDKNSSGLILLTNDGELANQIAKAGEFHEKEYLVRVNAPITEEFLKSMAKGVPILGKITAPCRIRQLSENLFDIVLIQGMNRQIRRMCEYLGYRVVSLKRVRVMNIVLGELPKGEYREVTEKEMEELKRLLSLPQRRPARKEKKTP